MKQFLIHFDVAQHYVEVDTFLASAIAAKKATAGLSSEFFDGKLAIELLVLPPEPGTLRQYLGIKIGKATEVALILWAAIQVMDSETVQEVSTELFGKKPAEILVDGIRVTKKQIEWLLIRDPESEELARHLVEEFVARSTQRSLEIDRGKLSDSGLPEQLKFELESAQSTLYRAAYDNPAVKGIGFQGDGEFPIKRRNFVERAIRPPKPTPKPDEDEWVVFEDVVRVTSPNFDQEDQAYRKWKGKSSNGGIVLFEITDEQFWSYLKTRKIEFGEVTELRLQMAVHKVGGRERQRKAIRVLSIDNKEFAMRLSEDALQAIIGDFRMAASSSPNQSSFLD